MSVLASLFVLPWAIPTWVLLLVVEEVLHRRGSEQRSRARAGVWLLGTLILGTLFGLALSNLMGVSEVWSSRSLVEVADVVAGVTTLSTLAWFSSRASTAGANTVRAAFCMSHGVMSVTTVGVAAVRLEAPSATKLSIVLVLAAAALIHLWSVEDARGVDQRSIKNVALAILAASLLISTAGSS